MWLKTTDGVFVNVDTNSRFTTGRTIDPRLGEKHDVIFLPPVGSGYTVSAGYATKEEALRELDGFMVEHFSAIEFAPPVTDEELQEQDKSTTDDEVKEV
jgi:hypothetical protein